MLQITNEDLLRKHKELDKLLPEAYRKYTEARDDYESLAQEFDALCMEAEARKLPGFSSDNPNPDL